ncbi:MAG TPA: beta-ketoacyl-ACP synthase III [Vicinamibacterales bacterium]|nr:beta-ketoacyl-ACP synthase III [Vicinamibacterales bacterium]
MVTNSGAPGPLHRARISSLATYVPPRLLTNADLEKMVATTDEWILQRTGIRERHIVDPGVATSDLCREAALKAIAKAGLTPRDIDFIVVGTTTPDMIFPSTACIVQAKIGATKAWGFDLMAACSGFTYGLTTAAQMVASGASRHSLVIGADVMSSIIDYTDRATCVLFGDGAGAVVVEATDDDGIGIIDFENYVDGSGGAALCLPAGGSLRPASHETIDQRLHYVKQDGQNVFKFAVRNTEEACRRILERNNVDANAIDLFVSHQANSRIIKSAADKLGLAPEKVVINIERFGNTTGGTIPLALNDAVADGRLKHGDLVLLASVGAGFTVGSVLLRWGLKPSCNL